MAASVITIACISDDASLLNSTFDKIIDYIEANKTGFEILKDEFEII